jgi:hypothetical protein
LPGQKVLSRFFGLPLIDKETIASIMHYEVKQQIPLPLEVLAWDYQMLDATSEQADSDAAAEHPIALFAIQSDDVKAQLQPLVDRKFKVDVVQSDCAALYNFLAYDRLAFELGRQKLPAGRQGVVALLDIGADASSVVVTGGGGATDAAGTAGSDGTDAAAKFSEVIGGEVTVNPDGTFVQQSGNAGTWECTDPARGRITMRWRDGGFVNSLVVSPDGQNISSTDLSQSYVTARRSIPGSTPQLVRKEDCCQEAFGCETKKIEAEFAQKMAKCHFPGNSGCIAEATSTKASRLKAANERLRSCNRAANGEVISPAPATGGAPYGCCGCGYIGCARIDDEFREALSEHGILQ